MWYVAMLGAMEDQQLRGPPKYYLLPTAAHYFPPTAGHLLLAACYSGSLLLATYSWRPDH